MFISFSLFLLLQEAYRRWVCSSLVPHFNYKGERVRPCLNVCQDVEQQCPYFLPGDRAPAYPTQYAGEPTFLCLGMTLLQLITKLFQQFKIPKKNGKLFTGTIYRVCLHVRLFGFLNLLTKRNVRNESFT